MSSTTTHAFTGPSPPFPRLSGPLPTLEQLYRMTSVPEERMVIGDVDWAFYEQLVDSIAEGANIHVDYDGKHVEIMALSPFHDGIKKRLGRFVELVTEELEIACTGLGQTTWKRPQIARGLEADECYYFATAKLTIVAEAMARMSQDLADYPDPDLAIEVDISASRIDRPGIYAAQTVAEVWRFDGNRRVVVIDRLTAGGTYEPVVNSKFLPVTADEVTHWVLHEDFRDGSQWAHRLRAWVGAEVATRQPC